MPTQKGKNHNNSQNNKKNQNKNQNNNNQNNNDQTKNANPTALGSMLVIMPPPELCPLFEPIRGKHIHPFVKCLAHISLSRPFLPNQFYFEKNYHDLLTKSLAHIEPFEVELSQWTYFQGNGTLFLDPSNKEKIGQIQKAVQQCVPWCNHVAKKRPFVPDFTKIKLVIVHNEINPDIETLLEFKKIYESSWTPIRFTVSEIYYVTAFPNERYEIRDVIGLNGKNSDFLFYITSEEEQRVKGILNKKTVHFILQGKLTEKKITDEKAEGSENHNQNTNENVNADSNTNTNNINLNNNNNTNNINLNNNNNTNNINLNNNTNNINLNNNTDDTNLNNNTDNNQ